MKKIILLLLLITSLGTSHLFAQNGGGGGQRMQKAWQSYLKDSVQLSDVLTDSVMAIRTEYQPQMRTIFMDQSASMQDKQSKMQSMRTEMEARYKSAGLTDDQIATIHKHEDDMRNRMMNRRNNGGNK